MPAIGFGLVWFGYALASWGLLLVRGKDVKFTDWINPVHPYQGSPLSAGQITSSSVFPTGISAAPKARAAPPPATGKIAVTK